MPIHFLFYVDIDFNSFDNIFIEETINNNNLRKQSQVDYLKEIFKLNNGNKNIKHLLNNIRDCILDYDYEKFSELQNDFSSVIYEHNRSILNDDRKRKMDFCNINTNELFFHLLFNRTSNPNPQTACEWLIFYKQMESGKNIVYNSASFRKHQFFHHLRMFREIFPQYSPVIRLYHTEHSNPNTHIIRMTKDRAIYKSWMLSYFDDYSDRLWKLVKNKRYNQNKDVCFLTYKYLIENKLDKHGLTKENTIFGSQAFWFGAGHGINTYEGFDVLIVFGDHLAGSQHYREYFLAYYPRDDLPNFDDVDKGIPQDRRLLEQFYAFQLDIYDAVHRLRPLKNNITIYWFGLYIPPELLNEFSVV
ncbi:hypothetical protein Metev_0343 [Methanohalobium evestigatum Z-7303]|uniref:Uncharacterized protein n=1 Tax=Methanohalobium evestigatum (strain ATCC BAA-1072 / DSM 3721 / NBRC 107634 / OCM 161 / Z-7303) TaxID=644295 RepID=D7E6P6_METEZ|nr:hypothetical protein [Methanohalobium evestigatum]ADI73268.1 hypothetical protein Metev_0343 [Methanohalobium evestigatum Z-7303]